MTTIPTIIYSFFAGSLSDDYGRKPLIILPTFGVVIGMFLSIVNYEFIDTLPIEFFYISGSCWWFFLGGNAVYYLGVYGFGASITTDENRALTLARFDAMETLGLVFGTIIFSKIRIIFKNFLFSNKNTLTSSDLSS